MKKARPGKPSADSSEPGRELRALFNGPPRYTLGVAESITCGRVQAAVGAFSGASDFFVGGLTAYALEQKVRHLGVDVAEAERSEGVSALIAGQMAVGACRLFRSDFAVATTGFAEPYPARGIKEPTAYWAIARGGPGGWRVVRDGVCRGRGLGRVAMQERVTKVVLATLVGVVRAMRTAAEKSNFA